MLNPCCQAQATWFLAYRTSFTVIGDPPQVFIDFLFTECLITYVQTCISTMDPGGLLHGGTYELIAPAAMIKYTKAVYRARKC